VGCGERGWETIAWNYSEKLRGKDEPIVGEKAVSQKLKAKLEGLLRKTRIA
jgi:hypothetical protein